MVLDKQCGRPLNSDFNLYTSNLKNWNLKRWEAPSATAATFKAQT
ncbi:hypothetical protein [Paenibacillus polymyxa]|nr:hypothetical protein [Paenibacillus polymyxa]